MEFIKQESEEIRIEEVFSLNQEGTGEQQDQMVLKEECKVLIKMEEKDQHKTQHFITEENSSVKWSNTQTISSQYRSEIIGRNHFSCQLCGKSFTRKNNLNRHIIAHTGERPYPCQQCGKSFHRSCTLNKHMRVHKGEKAPKTKKKSSVSCSNTKKISSQNRAEMIGIKRHFSCQQCGKSFTQKKNLNRHIIIHTGKRPYSCQQCGKSFYSSWTLNKHVKVHTREKPFLTKKKSVVSCPNTEKIFLQNMDQVAESKNYFSCQQCGKSFNHSVDLDRHILIHKGGKPFTCQQCGISFTRKSNLNRHNMVHTGERPYCCQQCGKSFHRNGSLNKHVKVHTREQLLVTKEKSLVSYSKTEMNSSQNTDQMAESRSCFSCPKCGKRFNQIVDLDRHILIHTGGRPFTCQQCGISFTRKSNLNRHIMVHTGERPYSCQQCGKSFNQTVDLDRHNLIHTGGRPFTCQQCGITFTRKSNLNRHLFAHTGERPYSCQQCGKSFHRNSTLKKHMRVHTGRKPYTCQHCGKQFRQKSEIIRHTRIHTGERPYACQYCGKRFNEKVCFNRHIRSHTGEKPYSCQRCGRRFSRKESLNKHNSLCEEQQRLESSREQPYTQCVKSFTQEQHFESHMTIHPGDQPFLCSQCGKSFRYNPYVLLRFVSLPHCLGSP